MHFIASAWYESLDEVDKKRKMRLSWWKKKKKEMLIVTVNGYIVSLFSASLTLELFLLTKRISVQIIWCGQRIELKWNFDLYIGRVFGKNYNNMLNFLHFFFFCFFTLFFVVGTNPNAHFIMFVILLSRNCAVQYQFM